MTTLTLLLLVCAAIIILVVLSVGILTFIKMGVIFHHAAQPKHQDTGNYTLDQGREVRPEHE